MSINEQQAEFEEFRLVLILPRSKMALVQLDHETHRLPRMNIPKWCRRAEQLGKAIRAKWGVQSIVIDILPEAPELTPCAVVEIRSPGWSFVLNGFVPVHASKLKNLEMTDIEYLTIERIIVGDTQARGPFSRLGWIDEAQEWIQQSVRDRHFEFAEEVRQLGCGSFSTLVRLEPSIGPAFWLKATSAAHAHEFGVTQTLARLCPDSLPPIVAARADWNAWVSEEEGRPIAENYTLAAFEQCTHSLAKIQIASALHVEELIICGCVDQRMSVLRSQIAQMMHYLDAAMRNQTSANVPVLSPKRLSEIGCLLEAASRKVESIGIPIGILHNDLNADNLLFDGVRGVLTDWCEAYLGCPFFTFQHLLMHSADVDESQTWGNNLKSIYKEHWRTVLSDEQIDAGFTLSPPLAIASHLCGRDPSFSSSFRNDPAVQSTARSLARYMDRFASSGAFLEALCD
jgi:hypothetical protein